VRRRLAAALALASLALGGAPALAASPQHVTLAQIESEVMCVTCQIPLAEAQGSAQADDERQFIQQLIDRGESEAQIKQALVATYGVEVLALPPAHGFDLAVYLVPAAAVLALLTIVATLLPRWRRRRPASPAAPAGPALSAADTARLDADLRRYEG
jgi:cytochrome c-type biogenesis protein CcmH